MNYRKSLALFLCVLCLSAAAQEIGKWRMYMSYQIATKSVMGGSVIYSLMNGNLLSYDTEDGEVRTYDRLGELSDVSISHIAYSKEARKLIIVYENSNIDLLDEEGNVENLSSLKEKRVLNKEIVSVCVLGSTAYLVTGFGFVEVDMDAAVFRNTYKLGSLFTQIGTDSNDKPIYNAILSIAVSDNATFLSTKKGVYYCQKPNNMHLEENWKIFQNMDEVKFLSFFQGKVIMVNSSGVYAADPATEYANTAIKRANYTYLKNTGSMLIWGNTKQVCYTSDVSGQNATALEAAVTTITVDNTWTDISYANGTYWMSEQEKGLCAYKTDGTTFTPTGEVIQPSSPIRDLGYRVSWVGDRLLVAGGINTVGGFSNPATSMYYENGEWTNFTEMEKTTAYSRIELINTTDLVQDPKDDTHHYASLYRNGLCEYKDGKFVKLHNYENSPLKSIRPTSARKYNYVPCAALSYDAEGNLWMASSMSDTVFHVLKPDGSWLNYYYKELYDKDEGVYTSLIDQILHHSNGNYKFVTSRRIEKRGIFCLDTNGTERADDDRTIIHRNIVNQDGTPYDPDQFYCLCEDHDGKVWVGTSSGLFVIDDVTKVFDPNYQFTQIKINRNDGSGLADYLLNDVSIGCITTDAANRKWIGTQTNGAYLITADGQEMVHHFTTEDSPLLSNNVQSIAVHPGTGEVVFGTDKGLCSYVSDATAPEDDLDKDKVVVSPNPVSPDYNGPIVIRGLVADTEVKIVTTGGQLVWNGSSVGGTCVWNGCANDGGRVSSGMYHVVANTPDGGKAIVTRIVIAR